LKADDLVNKTMEAAQKLNSGEVDKFFIQINVLSLGVLRGVHGDEFIRDFLQSAMDDRKPIRIVPRLLS